MDKRFWSGAIIVVTVVVAGASALPALLLRTGSLDEPLVVTAPPEPAPVVAKVEPVAKPVEPAPQVAQPSVAQAQVAEPQAAPPQAVQPAQPNQAAAVEPGSPVPAALPAPAAAAEPAILPAPAAQAAVPAPPTFPPVQPIGVAMQSGPDATPTQSRPVSAKPEGAKPGGQKAKREKTRMSVQDAKARKRPVRPAIYPLREFFAWRR